jgi:formate dehydrogenase major subunit
MKLAGAGAAGSAIAAFGFSEAEAQLAAHVRPFKLVQTREARTICPYCAVSCGMLLFAKPSPASNGKLEVTHIEGDSDHPVNRRSTTSGPRRACSTRCTASRAPTSSSALPGTSRVERIAKLMKDDRDANFIEKNNDGVTVNRWPTMAFLAGSSLTNEGGWVTYKVARGLGMLQIGNQARI